MSEDQSKTYVRDLAKYRVNMEIGLTSDSDMLYVIPMRYKSVMCFQESMLYLVIAFFLFYIKKNSVKNKMMTRFFLGSRMLTSNMRTNTDCTKDVRRNLFLIFTFFLFEGYKTFTHYYMQYFSIYAIRIQILKKLICKDMGT